MNIRDVCDFFMFEIQRESKLADYMEQRIEAIPEGFLIERNAGYNCYYYLHTCINGVKSGMTLDPSNDEHRKVIKELMEKKTIVHGLPILKNNIRLMEKCLKGLKQYHPTSFKYGELLGSGYYLEGDLCVRDWKKKQESQNPFQRQNLIHGTKRGVMVRSKSEVLIADNLYEHNLLSKYEVAVKLRGDKTVYPDFEILHPKTNELIWWEHLGMADDGKYMQNNLEKFEAYGDAGLVTGKNLILTSETADNPLTREIVIRKMKQYGLI